RLGRPGTGRGRRVPVVGGGDRPLSRSGRVNPSVGPAGARPGFDLLRPGDRRPGRIPRTRVSGGVSEPDAQSFAPGDHVRRRSRDVGVGVDAGPLQAGAFRRSRVAGTAESVGRPVGTSGRSNGRPGTRIDDPPGSLPGGTRLVPPCVPFARRCRDMMVSSSLAYPGSRSLAGWWRQLAPLHPRAVWLAHLLLHRVEALVRLN